MSFEFQEIPRVERLSVKQFKQEYLAKQKPVVIEKLTEDWPAYSLWNFEYIREKAGDKVVPLYDNEPVKAEDGFNEPRTKMPMRDYLDLLQSGPTDLRIFLYNLIRETPDLQQDYAYPDLGVKFLKGFPMLFLGGENARVFMHYDIDLANIFHFHFVGEKDCIIVPPEQSENMYKIPLSVICREDIDFDAPDFKRFPKLQQLKPYKTRLSHGEMLYMPEGYWHYMKYVTPGFSMSLRSLPTHKLHLAQALYNLFIMRHADGMLRKMLGQKWIDYKNKCAMQ
ncbi:MAG: cupin-like domain-containing protein [Weeksellaceae bacterium]|nr:cupin-like domain-containing protein [Weeksellaceae bacterium]